MEEAMKNRFAVVSLILGILSFVHLLGIEKAVLSVIFGVLALKEERNSKTAWSGITLGIVYLVIITTVVIIYFPRMIVLLDKIK
jgi:hypothetical protein